MHPQTAPGSRATAMRHIHRAAACVLLCALFAAPCRSEIPIIRTDVLLLSSRIDIPAMTSRLAQAELLAKAYQFDLAAAEIEKILADQSVTATFGQVVAGCGPVGLCLESARLFYQTKQTRVGNDGIAAFAQALISTYAEQAAGRDWHAYELLFQPVTVNARRTGDSAALLGAHERLVLYDPANRQNSAKYLDLVIAEGRITTNTLAVIRRIESTGCESDAVFSRMRCDVLRLAGQDAFGALLQWLRRFPDRDIPALQKALELGSSLVKENESARRARYITALTNLALAQRPVPGRNQALALILAERGKWQQAATSSPPSASSASMKPPSTP